MRPLIYGNGRLLVCVDERGVVRDVYYPYAGLENHGSYMRLGLYESSTRKYGWLEDWKKSQQYQKKFPEQYDHVNNADQKGTLPVHNSLIGLSVFENHDIGAGVSVREMVHQSLDFFLRTIEVKNISDSVKYFKLFSTQAYHIMESGYANTAIRDGPILSHYKWNRFFLHSSEPLFDQFTTGQAEWRHMQGTWKDAEDGELAGHQVTQGMVDSTLRWTMPPLHPGESYKVYFWMCAGGDYLEARRIHDWIKKHDFETLYHSNHHYWNSFTMKAHNRFMLRNFYLLPQEVQEAFNRSILAVACHLDRGGSIIASCDSEIKQQGADFYTYCWPRDAAWVTIALDKAGYAFLSRKTYDFFERMLDPKGFFRQKFTPAGDLGSTWHPPPMIQIDETALPLYAVYRNWVEDRNIMTIADLYEPLIKPAANFLTGFIDPYTKLPRPSFDLWEERKDVNIYACSNVYAGLNSASSIAMALGDDDAAKRWGNAALSLKDATIRRLYDPHLGRFKRSIGDETVDASAFAAWYLGIVPANDPMAVNTMRAIEHHLKRPNGGIARYQGDRYQGYMNSWPICTLWLAQWYIRLREFENALALIMWAATHSTNSGLMPEQVGDHGEMISVLPLAWSHSSFILTVIEYLEAIESGYGRTL